jgi:putative transposase
MAHRKKLKRVHEPGHFHELTFSCYRRIPLLTNDVWCSELARLLDLALAESNFELNAFVFMPDHVHLLVYPTEKDPQIGRFLARFKQPFSKYVKSILVEHKSPLLEKLSVRERPGKICFRLWQEGGGYDRNLFEPSTIEASISYIHMNPVKKGLCKFAVDWKWSSARWYLDHQLKNDLPKISFPSAELFHKGGVQIPHS